ncbi:hypothetical protein ACLOJK_007177 [Asimina triloba]
MNYFQLLISPKRQLHNPAKLRKMELGRKDPIFLPWGGSNGDNEDGESRSLIPEVVPNCSLEELAALDDLRAEKGSNSIKGEDEYGNWKVGNNGVQTDERRRMRGRGRRRWRKNK